MSSVLQELMVVFSSYNKDREGDSRFVIAIIIYKFENYKHIHQFSFFFFNIIFYKLSFRWVFIDCDE